MEEATIGCNGNGCGLNIACVASMPITGKSASGCFCGLQTGQILQLHVI